MRLFDILKAQAGIPVDDPLAIIFGASRKSPEPSEQIAFYESTGKPVIDYDGKKLLVRG